MSSKGHEKQYKFGAKNQWRRTIWNLIDDRLRVHRSKAIVLYLAGEADLDREILIRKGFDSRNLIAVERNVDVVASLRARGILTIQGDFFGVVKAWKSKLPIDVVYGDFCCGLSAEVIGNCWALPFLPALRSSVFAFNLQRGRDATGNEVRDCRAPTLRSVMPPDWRISEKHRGAYAFEAFLVGADSAVHGGL